MISSTIRWLRSDLQASVSLGFLLLLALLAIAAPFIAPYSPTAQDLDNLLADPSPQHLLGTDDLGRDILSRLIHGAPVTLYASFLAVGIAILLGVPVGLIAGFMGGWVDDAISRFLDALLSFPAIVLAIAVTGALGIGLTNGMISVGIVFSPQLARLVRARTLVVRRELYVDAASCFGATTGRILWKHVLPNTVQPVIVQVRLLLAAALLAEASLSFLGLGDPSIPTWGQMLQQGFQTGALYVGYWWRVLPPGILIVLTAIVFMLLALGMEAVVDPRMRERR